MNTMTNWTGWDAEMQAALEADGEKLRQLTGVDNGPYFAGKPYASSAVTVRHWGVCSDEQNAVPSSLMAFRHELDKAIAEIPPEYLDSAEIDFRHDYEFGESYDACRITYERPETPEETAARIDGERAHWSEQLASARERVTYCTAQLDALPVKRRV